MARCFSKNSFLLARHFPALFFVINSLALTKGKNKYKKKLFL